jgi:hypothetical protein
LCCSSKEHNISEALHSFIFPTQLSSQLETLDLDIIHALKCFYRKQLIWLAVVMIDQGLLQDAVEMKLDLSALCVLHQKHCG